MRRIVMALILLLTFTTIQAQDEKLQIVVSFSILADVVQNVAGDAADVSTLIPVGADPHAFTPSARDLAALAEADVVFINGAGFEASMMETIENAAPDVNVVIVSSCVPVLEIGATTHDEEAHHDEAESTPEADPVFTEICERHAAELETGEADHEHEVEPLGALYAVECEGNDPESSDDHEHTGCDPHVWTNPHNILYWTLMIRDTLSELAPTNSESFSANAASYMGSVEALVHDFIEPAVATLPAENRVLVTNHETLGYFAAEYGFKLVGTVIPGNSTAAEPGAADIAALIDLIKAEGVPAIFAENTVNTQLAEQIASEGGASFYTLYSDSLGEPEATTYLDYMRYNVTTIVTALGGHVE